MKFLRNKDVAIIACADTKLVRGSGRSVMSFAGEVLGQVLNRGGLERSDIDGLAMTVSLAESGNPFWTNIAAETLGLTVSWCQLTDIGGASAIGNVARAAAAIHAGLCGTVLCLAADAPTTQDSSNQTGYRPEFGDPFGYGGPPVVFGLISSAYRERYGLPEQALAKLAVAQRRGALQNANACDVLRVPLTAEGYLSSRMIADPIRLLDCVMRCDGANACIVTTTENARRLGAKKIVHPVAYREMTNFDAAQAVDDITISGFSVVGPAALEDAGMSPGDIHMLHPYDDFLIAVILQLEQIGLAPAGGGGEFIRHHDVDFGGDFPINTGGGQISAGQPGLAGGGVNLTEALTQLFGDAGERQVRRARNAMVTGIGAMQYARNWGSSAVLLLEFCMMAGTPLPMSTPRPSDVTKEFWAATAAGKFLLQHDERAAGRLVFPPRPVMDEHGKARAWAEASGTGVLVAVTLCRVPARGFQDKAPYLVGIVRLDEGPRVFATIVNAQADDIRPGRKMRMVWLDGGGETRRYAFVPAT